MVKLKNLFQAIKYQGFKEFFITKNGFGIFSINSHMNQHTGKLKVEYHTEESARKAAEAISRKTGRNLVAYKCIFCDSWHIGNNKN